MLTGLSGLKGMLGRTGVNFINVIRTRSFYVCRSQKRKNSVKSSVSFYMLLGSERAKAAQKMLMKLTPGGNS
jgi:hypothetical protein